MAKGLAGNARHLLLHLGLGTLLTAGISLPAQVAPLAPKWLAGTPIPAVETFADGLTRHYIELTEAALIAALQNSDGEVRSLAAAQLAATDDRPALKAILSAVELERDVQVQVNMAGAATWLDSQRALDRLQLLCQNLNVPSSARLDAARYVSNKEIASCYPMVEQIAQTDHDASMRVLALETAMSYRGQSDKAQALALSTLSDSDPNVRIASVEALHFLHATGAIDTLRHALEIDGDETVREYIREAIRILSIHDKTQ